MKWLSEQEMMYVYLCTQWDDRRWNHRELQDVCNKRKRASLPFIHTEIWSRNELMLIISRKSVENEWKSWFCVKKHQVNMYTNIKTQATLYYQRMWAEHSREQISEDFTNISQYSCSTACHNTVATANMNKYTRNFLLALYFLTFLVRMNGKWAECTFIERNIEQSVTWCSDDGWGRGKTWTLLGGAAYISGGRKFSAYEQNDSSRLIICLNYFFVFELLVTRGIVSALLWINVRFCFPFSQMGLCLIILWQHLHFLYIAIADVANDLKTNASISGVRTGSGLVVIGIILTFSFQYFL